MHTPILTLITDFGTRDGYVGAMKGSILTMAPNVAIHDITHGITPQQVWEGAWCLRRAAPRFPPGTVHLAVVDPGVGSSRSGIVIETTNYLLVGPDNGLLALAAQDDGIQRIVEIEDESGEAWQRSATFDGLSLFAPVAAQLLAGVPLEDIGPEAEDMVELPEPEPARQGHFLEGEVVLFDRFGNAMTNISTAHVEPYGIEHIYLADGAEVQYIGYYAELAGSTGLGAIFNSDGRLELALYGESAQRRFNLRVGQKIRVLLRPP